MNRTWIILLLTLAPAAHARSINAGFVRVVYPSPAPHGASAQDDYARQEKLRRWKELGDRARAGARQRAAESEARYQELLARGRALDAARKPRPKPKIIEVFPDEE